MLLKAYPNLAFQAAMAPVDYISRAVVHLSTQPRSFGRNFHLVNPNPISFRELVQIISAEGYALSELDYDAWRAALNEAASNRTDRIVHEAFTQIGMLLRSRHHLFSARPQYEVPNSSEGLAGSAITCPPTDAALIKTYLAYFQAIGFLPPP